MKKINSSVPFNYVTIKITKSRIDKGLLAIPVSLIDLFPKNSSNIHLLDISGKEEIKNFTQYNSSSKECRIGGLKNFYTKYNVSDGEELVIQLLDDNKYKIIPEKIFEKLISEIEFKLDRSVNETEFEQHIFELSKVSNTDSIEVIQSEFVRLSQQQVTPRKARILTPKKVKESVPASLRKILLELYKGRCQVSDFTFLMNNGNPYFEIHHINPLEGNHFKNLLVVSPNVHKQFTYAKLEQFFDEEQWIREVKFNENKYSVFQVIDNLPKSFEKEVHY
jgi:predicted restriction endonuclease